MSVHYPHAFQVLVDDNLILQSETLVADQFKADGAYSLPSNSSAYQSINWPNYYTDVGANQFCMSEDVGEYGPPTDYMEVDLVGGYRLSLPNACMFYNEGAFYPPFPDPSRIYYASVAVSSASPAVVTWVAHGLSTGFDVQFSASVMPTGISAATTYYVTVVTANTFKISTSLANLAALIYVNSSSTGTAVKAIHADAFDTTPSSTQIAAFAAHIVPGALPFPSAVGAGICPMLRTYTGAYKTKVDLALANPLVSGVVAEVNINPPNFGATDIPGAVLATVAAGKKFFFLTSGPDSFHWAYDLENYLNNLVANGVNLANPNLYLVLGVYGHPEGRGGDIGLHPITVSYPNQSAGDLVSMQNAIAFCNDYRDRMKGAAAGTYLGNSYLGDYWGIEGYPSPPTASVVRLGGHRVPMMLDRSRVPVLFTPGNAPTVQRRTNAPEVLV